MNMVELSETTIGKLQAMKQSTDTFDSVVSRLIDFHAKGERLHEPKTDVKSTKENDPPIIGDANLDAIKNIDDATWDAINRELDAESELARTFFYNDQKERISYPHNAVPNVEFTKCQFIEVEGKALSKLNWNAAVRAVLTEICLSGRQIPRHLHGLQIVDDEKTDHGFVFVEEINKSIQGVDSNVAARALFALAEEYGLSVTVFFQWRKKERAAFPGRKGMITIN